MKRLWMISAALFLFTAPAAAQQGDAPQREKRINPFSVSASTGVDFSSGDYGLPDDTDILVVPLSVRAKAGKLSFSATLPWIRVEGPAGIVIGPDGQPLPGVPIVSGVREGLGDLSVGATYTVPARLLDGLELGLGGRVKLPTSPKSRGLTTGKADFTVSADLSYAAGPVVPFVNLGYRFLGDPTGFDLRNGPTASVGATARLGGSAVLIGSYDYARASSALTEDSHELFGGISARLSKGFNLTGYGVAGLSRGSPDFGVGLLLTVGIF
jgi:hypothetical protein